MFTVGFLFLSTSVNGTPKVQMVGVYSFSYILKYCCKEIRNRTFG